jgi:hypothetical protein
MIVDPMDFVGDDVFDFRNGGLHEGARTNVDGCIEVDSDVVEPSICCPLPRMLFRQRGIGVNHGT